MNTNNKTDTVMADETYINIDVGDAVELEAVAEGEYRLRCTKAEVRTSQKTGGQYLMLNLDIPEIIQSKGINHVMMFPTSDDEPKTANNRKLAIKHACEAFGVSTSQFQASDFVGKEAWARLAKETSDDYGEQNRVREWIRGA